MRKTGLGVLLRSIVRNASSNVLLMILKLGITLLVTPILVRSLGNFDYGIWQIAVSIFGYLGLLDMGILPAIEVFASRYSASGQSSKLGSLYYTAFYWLLFVAIVSGMLWIGWVFFWVPGIGAGSQDKYWFFAFVILIQFFVVFPGLAAQAILRGFERFVVISITTACTSIVGAVVIIAFMSQENALILLAITTVLGLAVKFSVFYWILHKMGFSATGAYSGKPKKATAKRLMAFGAKSFIQGSSAQAEVIVAPLLISAVLGPAAIIYYVIPNGLFLHAQNVVRSISAVFVPAFSRVRESGEKNEERMLHARGSRLTVGLMLLLVLGVAMLGPEFISSWIGPEYGGKAEELVWALAVYYILSLVNPFAVRYLTAINRHGILAIVRPIKLLVLIALAWFLLEKIGIVGLAIAAAITEALFVFIPLVTACRNLGITVGQFLTSSVAPAIGPAVALVLVCETAKSIFDLDNILSVLLVSMVGAAVYLGTFLITGISTVERGAFLKWCRGNFSKR